MSEGLSWKYWDNVCNCWQYIDSDELYDQDEKLDYISDPVNTYQKNTDWPDLSIIDLMTSEHLRHGKAVSLSENNAGEEYVYIKGARSRMKSNKSRRNHDVLNEKYDSRSLSRLAMKQNLLDIPQYSKSLHSRTEKNWERSLRTPLSSDSKDTFISSGKHPDLSQSLNALHRKPSRSEKPSHANRVRSVDPAMDEIDQKTKRLIWQPRARNTHKEESLIQSTPGVKTVLLTDQFTPTNGEIIHVTNPIASTNRKLMKRLSNSVGYEVEPITGTGVRPPTQLENYRCYPRDQTISRPQTPIEIKRLRLLPTPAVRKCMAEALKTGILEPEDAELIMDRINNKRSDRFTDEENIKNQSKRLISPLKYPRRPGPDLGPIYKLDDKKLIPRQKEEEPMFKGLRTSEKSIIPTQLEIPFLQNYKKINRRMKSKTWQNSLRSNQPETLKTLNETLIVNFIENQKIAETNVGYILSRPMPPPPSPIKNLMSSVIPELKSKYSFHSES